LTGYNVADTREGWARAGMRGYGSWARPSSLQGRYAVSITRKDCGKARQRWTNETLAEGMPGFLSLAARVRGTPLTLLKISGSKPFINRLDLDGWVLSVAWRASPPNVPPNYPLTNPPSMPRRPLIISWRSGGVDPGPRADRSVKATRAELGLRASLANWFELSGRRSR
jgi:hypothetical protein